MDKKEISKSASNMAKKRWSKTTKEERSKHGRDLVNIRWKKHRENIDKKEKKK